MKNNFKLVAGTICLFLLTGCDKQIEDWVKEKRPDRYDQPSTSTPTVAYSMKVTPGKLNGSATGLAVRAIATPTNQTFNLGADMAVNLTINRSRSGQ